MSDKKVKESCRYYLLNKKLKGFKLPYCNHKLSIITSDFNCENCIYYQNKL